jgi:hypothetical protein
MIKTRALSALRPGVEYTMTNDDLSTVMWNSPDITTPTETEVNAKIAELEAADTQAVINKAAALASAEAKLTALGLSATEVAALLSK